MAAFLQLISENRELIFSGLGTAILIFILTKKYGAEDKPPIVKIFNKIVNNNNNNQNNTEKNGSHQKERQPKNNKNIKCLEYGKAKLYSTGVRGKVFTSIFYKSINHNFGVELMLKNNSSTLKKVSIGWCIYDTKGNTVFKRNFKKEIKPHSSINTDFYVAENDFMRLKPGKYNSQIWIDNIKIPNEYFTITYK